MGERKKVLLRLDPQVYEALARWAADDLRSVNAQIEHALRCALRAAGRPAANAIVSQASPDERSSSDPDAEGPVAEEPVAVGPVAEGPAAKERGTSAD